MGFFYKPERVDQASREADRVQDAIARWAEGMGDANRPLGTPTSPASLSVQAKFGELVDLNTRKTGLEVRLPSISESDVGRVITIASNDGVNSFTVRAAGQDKIDGTSSRSFPGEFRMVCLVAMRNRWAILTSNSGRWEDLRYPTSGVAVSGISSEPDRSSTTGLLLFDPTDIESIGGVAQLPHAYRAGSPIRPHIHVRPTTDPAGASSVWILQYKWYNVNDQIPLSYTSDTIVVDHVNFSGGLATHEAASFSEVDGAGKRDSSIFEWRLGRLPGNASDNYGSDVELFEFDIHVILDSEGSYEEFPNAP
ncbi:MAG: hypothetical protein QNJ16_18810 [Rhodobacter sp.]|nr:hypothetical protein [Rhodobacter sp.]